MAKRFKGWIWWGVLFFGIYLFTTLSKKGIHLPRLLSGWLPWVIGAFVFFILMSKKRRKQKNRNKIQ